MFRSSVCPTVDDYYAAVRPNEATLGGLVRLPACFHYGLLKTTRSPAVAREGRPFQRYDD